MYESRRLPGGCPYQDRPRSSLISEAALRHHETAQDYFRYLAGIFTPFPAPLQDRTRDQTAPLEMQTWTRARCGSNCQPGRGNYVRRCCPLILLSMRPMLRSHHDEGWRSHQPASSVARWSPRKWDVAVSAANVTEMPALRDMNHGGSDGRGNFTHSLPAGRPPSFFSLGDGRGYAYWPRCSCRAS
jgi:hypothetical protein